MSNDNEKIIGCFLQYPFPIQGLTVELAKERGDLFHQYIWGQTGIANHLNELKYYDYGEDLLFILFEFSLAPIPDQFGTTKEIGRYIKKEKSIGIPVLITNENFFDRSEDERWQFLKDTVLHRLDLLTEVVRKKKLDTNMDLLKSDVKGIFEGL